MNKKSFHLYNKFVGFITKKGKKPKAKFIFDSALFSVTQKLKIPLNKLLLKIFLKLNSYIEIKTIKIDVQQFLTTAGQLTTTKSLILVRGLSEQLTKLGRLLFRIIEALSQFKRFHNLGSQLTLATSFLL